MTRGVINREAEASVSAELARKTFCYDPGTGTLCWRNWSAHGRRPPGSIAGCTRTKQYPYIWVKWLGRAWGAHRLIWLIVTGAWPENEVDHKNGERSDNRWTNLRPATRGQQSANSRLRKDNKSGYRGVTWSPEKQKWHAALCVNHEQRSLGEFKTIEAAAAAYDAAFRRAYGEYAKPS